MDAVKNYMRLLRGSAEEIQAAFREVLICVTGFFREPESFAALERDVLPRLFSQRTACAQDAVVRIWVVGCSTGEEAYSLAMLCAEQGGRHEIFATDLNAAAIEKARAGIYPKSIAENVSAERLRRFFVEKDDHYEVCAELKKVCQFARHDALSEPPIAGAHLISCRNLLIYLDETMQDRLVPTLHRALLPAGLLWLGNTEHIAAYRELFTLEDQRHKVYARRAKVDLR